VSQESDAFIAAVLADPEDDAPRLIYADWLDEHGQSAYAEFIRVQVAVARHAGKWDDRTRALGKRERALLLELRESHCLLQVGWGWTFYLSRQGPPNQYAYNCAGFARGFTSEVTLRAWDWCRLGDRVLSLQPVSQVRLVTWPQIERHNYGSGYLRFQFAGCPREAFADVWGLNFRENTALGAPVVRALLKALWPGVHFDLPPRRQDPVGPGVEARFAVNCLAAGTVYPSRFVEALEPARSAGYSRVVQCAAGGRVYGVSQPGTRNPPGGFSDDGSAAHAGDMLFVYPPPSSGVRVELGNRARPGDRLRPGARGRALAGRRGPAVAMEAGEKGDLVLCALPWAPSPAGGRR